MQSYCTDCSYRGKISGQGGLCPACGSPNFTRGKRSSDEAKPPSKWRLVVLAVLWGYLITQVSWKLLA